MTNKSKSLLKHSCAFEQCKACKASQPATERHMQSHTRNSPPVSYRVNDAANALGISRRTIYRLIDGGKLRSTKIGRATLIPAGDVHALIAIEA